MTETQPADATTPAVPDLIAELEWRGLLHQCTDADGLRAHLADPANAPRKIYSGFDPTAPSLTIGNLVPIMLLAHVKRAGHTPVVVMGGGTGLIGDPSGKSAERKLNTPDIVAANVDAQRPIYEAVLGTIEGPDHAIVNNLDWLGGLGYIEALRDIGKHFSVNMMMQKESVKSRLDNREQGISYTEFSYMILQAYDFAHLYEHEGVTVQIGGSDQYGNIVAGTDLIRRMSTDEGADERDEKSFGITAPLVTKADGTKFGKTESGAVWLTADRTSPYAYYQFWLNSSDDDATNWIKVFTFLPQDEIEAILARHAENPGARELQRTLARQATTILHGDDAMRRAEAAGKALFSGEIADLDEPTLLEVLADVPSSEHAQADLEGDGLDPIDLLKRTGLASSNREAREFLANGSVSVNGAKLDADTRLTGDHLLHGSLLAVRRGKKKWHLTRWN
jgi:tyrosyl-tRNA synthetase